MCWVHAGAGTRVHCTRADAVWAACLVGRGHAHTGHTRRNRGRRLHSVGRMYHALETFAVRFRESGKPCVYSILVDFDNREVYIAILLDVSDGAQQSPAEREPSRGEV